MCTTISGFFLGLGIEFKSSGPPWQMLLLGEPSSQPLCGILSPLQDMCLAFLITAVSFSFHFRLISSMLMPPTRATASSCIVPSLTSGTVSVGATRQTEGGATGKMGRQQDVQWLKVSASGRSHTTQGRVVLMKPMCLYDCA